MTRLFTSGAEIYVGSSTPATGSFQPDGNSFSGATRDTSVKRSGAASFQYTVSTSAPNTLWTGPALVLDRGYWIRFYLNITTNVSSNMLLALLGQSNSSTVVYLTPTGAVYVGSDTGTVSASLADGNWHRIEFYVKSSATQANRAFELRVDGVTIKSGAAQTDCGAVPDAVVLGVINGVVSGLINIDDVALNDDQGAAPHNTWPGDGYVVLLTPSADNTRGSWTGGAGGTTSLWDALNNTPPVGAAAPGTNTSQISANAVATTGKFDTASYTAAGATAGHTAVLCQVVACHGEQVATGTKSGSASTDTAVNNTPSSTATFNYGDDAGTEGAWPSLWRWSLGAAVAYATQPTLSSGARLNIVTTTVSRVADCCFLGLYVEMKSAVGAAVIPDVGMALTVT